MATLQDRFTAGIVEVDDDLADKLTATGQYAAPEPGVGWPARAVGDYAFGFKNIPGYGSKTVAAPPPVADPPPAAAGNTGDTGGEAPPEEPAPAPAPPPAPAPKDPEVQAKKTRTRTGA